MAEHFKVPAEQYKSVGFNVDILNGLLQQGTEEVAKNAVNSVVKTSVFNERKLDDFITYKQAYHQLILDIIVTQYFSTGLVLQGSAIEKIFVDGGFSKNPIYMNLLAAYFPKQQVFAASVAQASAIGAALCLHSEWNDKSLPADMIQLKSYPPPFNIK